jgi:Zn-dependent protease with chaperone function
LDFFARQEQSRRTSRMLVGAFVLAFTLVALATTLVVAVVLRTQLENNALYTTSQTWWQWVDAHLALVGGVAAATLVVMGLASLYRATTLSRGGGQVARMLGATPVTGQGGDLLQRRLVNVVEEMALAAGVAVPDIFILEKEASINAFAAGLSPADAAITVTRGALEQLDRAELQGVVAHEFSHILNGDMRLNQQLIGMSFGILVLSLAGRWLLRSSRFRVSSNRKNNGVAAAMLIGLALVVIGAIGVFLTRLIKAGVSRQRERLADASAVQFTREPQGLAGALKKIGGFTSRIESVETEEVAHMLFDHGAGALAGLLATHPPLLERIRALEPDFDPRDLPPPRDVLATQVDESAASGTTAGFAPATSGAALLANAGAIAAPAVGEALHAAVPDEVRAAARSRDSSLLLALALALAGDPGTRERQLALLERQLGAARTAVCRRLHDDVDAAGPELRLPILELALPAIKERPREQLDYLFDLLDRLAELDTAPRLFDFVLLHVLTAYLRGAGARRTPRASGGKTPNAGAAVQTLLATVAAFGNADGAAARAAYAAGIEALGAPQPSAAPPAFAPLEQERDVARLDGALDVLARLRPEHKKRLLHGVLAAIRADGTITPQERELLRAIAATLDCPLPPGIAT